MTRKRFGTIAAALALAWIPATYTASAVLLINARGNNVVDIQSVRDDLSLNRNAAEVINSEVAILTSRGLAERVIA